MCVSHQIAVSWVRNSTIKGDPWLEYNCKGTGNQWLTNAALYSLKRDTQGVGILIFPTNPGGVGGGSNRRVWEFSSYKAGDF